MFIKDDFEGKKWVSYLSLHTYIFMSHPFSPFREMDRRFIQFAKRKFFFYTSCNYTMQIIFHKTDTDF